MFTTNLQLLLVTFTIKVALKITYKKKKKKHPEKKTFLQNYFNLGNMLKTKML